MNVKEAELKLTQRIKDLLGSIPWLGDVHVSEFDESMGPGYDLEVSFSTENGNQAILQVECKTFPRPSQFPGVNQVSRYHQGGNRRSTEIPVLAAPRISPRMAELCEEHGWGWFDLAGNCKISVPNMLHIERQGHAPVKIDAPVEINLGTVEASRVVRALLTNKDLKRNWTQRNLRDACSPSVSLGLVNKVVRYLKDQAYLGDVENGRGIRLRDPLGLLREWSQNYRFSQHARHEYFTLLKPAVLRQKLVDQFSGNNRQFALAVFSAASEQAGHVRGELKLWLYIDEKLRGDFMQIAQAENVNSGANLVVMVPEDPGVFTKGCKIDYDGMPVTHPIQTYVDLKQAGGRGEEAAEALLEQKIKPAWKDANLVW